MIDPSSPDFVLLPDEATTTTADGWTTADDGTVLYKDDPLPGAPLPGPPPRATRLTPPPNPVSVKLPVDLVRVIDDRRGETSRQRWVADACRSRLEPQAPPSPPPERYTGPPVPNATADCPHPEASLQHYPWGTICGLCGART